LAWCCCRVAWALACLVKLSMTTLRRRPAHPVLRQDDRRGRVSASQPARPDALVNPASRH
jgi:hypothetical protein